MSVKENKIEERVLKVHHSSQELSEITSMINSCSRVLQNESKESFQNKVVLKIQIAKDKPVVDGGFTDYNVVELSLNKSDILTVCEVLSDKYKFRRDFVLKELKNI